MSTSDYKDGVTKSKLEVNLIHNNTTTTTNIVLSVCANCGKEDANNICNKCKQVRYCNAACKKVHRSKHKKQCERRAAELHDEKLFKQPPPNEDCPICFLRIPRLKTGRRYQSCCGKVICSGCVYAPLYDDQGNEVDNQKCPFCRTSFPTTDEGIERLKQRMEVNDPIAIYNTGNYYRDGRNGYRVDHAKALELWHHAGELGYAEAYCKIGYAYEKGEGVVVDKKKANHYYELAAMGGNLYARYNLGLEEERVGNMERALNHHMIAVRAGDSDSLKEIQEMYSEGDATKEDYMKALQSYQTYLGEIKSKQRDEAAAFDSEEYRYY